MPYTSKKPSHHVARVSKAPIVACLTCPLCGNLFREATTISECLHTFCKECIHERFNDEETNSCPMCNVSLGCVPLEKLRADPQMDDVQAKIFNFNPKKRPAESASSPPPSTHAPARRKERSLSSLGVVSMPSTSKSRKARQKTWVNKDSSDSEEEHEENNDDDDEDDDDDNDDTQEHAESQENGMYCSETLDSDSKSVERVLLDSRAENELLGTKRSKLTSGGNRESPKQLDADFLSPLACLAELADADEKHSTRGSSKAARSSSPCLPSSSGLVKEEEEENNRRSMKETSSLRATKNVRRSSQGKSASRKNGATPLVQQTSNGLWFTLKSATSQGEDGGFPQITTPYLRIKDGKLPVSYVRKYLVKKLDLKSESEVEITCRGQPVVSSLPLESVRKIWLAKDSPASQRGGLNHQPGASGKEFLMVLTYGRNRRAMLN